jgi:clan AA aspartic protease
MIQGIVNGRLEATVQLQIRGLYGTKEVEAIVDTGYSGLLALPTAIVDQLGLVRCGESSVVLADDTSTSFDVYSADLERDGSFDNVIISVLGEQCLVGMEFLEGHELRIQVKPDGSVQITKL